DLIAFVKPDHGCFLELHTTCVALHWYAGFLNLSQNRMSQGYCSSLAILRILAAKKLNRGRICSNDQVSLMPVKVSIWYACFYHIHIVFRRDVQMHVPITRSRDPRQTV